MRSGQLVQELVLYVWDSNYESRKKKIHGITGIMSGVDLKDGWVPVLT